MPTEIGDCCCPGPHGSGCSCDEGGLGACTDTLPTGWDIDLSELVPTLDPDNEELTCAIDCYGDALLDGCYGLPQVYRTDSIDGCTWSVATVVLGAPPLNIPLEVSISLTVQTQMFEDQLYVCYTLTAIWSWDNTSYDLLACKGGPVTPENPCVNGVPHGSEQVSFKAIGLFPVDADDCYEERELDVIDYFEGNVHPTELHDVPPVWCKAVVPQKITVTPYF